MQDSGENSILRRSADNLLAHWHWICPTPPKIGNDDRPPYNFEPEELSGEEIIYLRNLREAAEVESMLIFRVAL
jgi:hypothetical protein